MSTCASTLRVCASSMVPSSDSRMWPEPAATSFSSNGPSASHAGYSGETVPRRKRRCGGASSGVQGADTDQPFGSSNTISASRSVCSVSGRHSSSPGSSVQSGPTRRTSARRPSDAFAASAASYRRHSPARQSFATNASSLRSTLRPPSRVVAPSSLPAFSSPRASAAAGTQTDTSSRSPAASARTWYVTGGAAHPACAASSSNQVPLGMAGSRRRATRTTTIARGPGSRRRQIAFSGMRR